MIKPTYHILFIALLLILIKCQTIDETITARISVSSSLGFLNTIGLCFFYGGLVTPKNFVAMMGQILFIYAEITCLWTFIGYTLVYGGSQSRFLGGVDHFALRDLSQESSDILPSIPGLLFYYNTLQTAAITPAIYTGSTAERVRFFTISLLAPIWSILVFCPIAHWNQHPEGFLRDLGADASSGNSVNIAAGTTSLALALFTDYVSKRKKQAIEASLKHIKEIQEKQQIIKRAKKHGRQVVEIDPEDDQNYSQQSSAFVFLGISILWLGALIGSSGNIITLINTNLSASTGLITWLVLEYLFEKKYSLVGMCVGILCGLVGISQGGNYVPIYASACIGIISTVCSFFFYRIVDKLSLKFDDRLGVFGCHGICGIVGAISFGFFGNTQSGAKLDGVYYGGNRLLGVVFAGVCCSFLWSFVVTIIIASIMYILGLYQIIDEDNINEEKDFDEQAVFLPDIDKIIKKYSTRKSLWQAKKSVYVGVKNQEDPPATSLGMIPGNKVHSGDMLMMRQTEEKL